MKLTDLKVARLKEELEKRELDKNGVKAVLQERLQKALKDEGQDPDTFVFGSESNDASLNESQEEDVKVPESNGDEEQQMEEDTEANNARNEATEANKDNEDTEANDKEEEQIVVNEEEMGEFDSEKPKDKKKSGTKEKGGSPSKSPPRPDTVPVVVPFTSKDTIELSSKLKPSSDDASLVVHMDGQSVRSENIGENGTAEEAGEETGESSTTPKKTEDSAAKSSQSNEATTETKEKDKKQQSSPNLWVSGLASTTRATDLKQIFSKHGKVTGAKVVTNAKTPGSRCFGFVTMASSEEASTCIQHLHRTELHGRMISVERAKTEPAVPQKKKEEKKVTDADKEKEAKSESATTEKDHRKPSDNRHQNHRGSASHRDRAPRDVLSFDKITEERERQKIRDQERQAREDSRRQRDEDSRRFREERERQRERERRHRDEQMRMEREKRELRMERHRLEKEKMELLKIQKEQTRIERRRIEREKEQLLREQRRLSEAKRRRSPDHGYDDRKKSRYASSRDSRRSRDKDDFKLKLERERLMRRRSPVDSRRVVERPRYKEEVPSRWPPTGTSSHHSTGPAKPAGLHHSTPTDPKWTTTPGWNRLGATAPLLGTGGGGWGAPMGAPPPSHMMMSHHGMGGNPPYGAPQPPSYPVMRRY